MTQPRIRGRFGRSTKPVLERYAEKCRFDPTTGCVLWTGATKAGQGNSARYGGFWYEGEVWAAHRWSGIFIHGLDLEGKQAGHCCPHGPNTLCVQHVIAQTQLENLDEMNTRRKVQQSAHDRQFWLFVSLGIEPAPVVQQVDPDAIPFYEPPTWLRPFLIKRESDNECPF